MPLKIDQMYAFVMADEDGDEGIPAFSLPESKLVMPMVGADMKRIEQLKPIAQKMANDLKKPVRICKFTVREEVEVVEPETVPAGKN